MLTPEHSEYILEQLVNTSFDIRKIAELPENVTVAQKFGVFYTDAKQYMHSCGIIYLGEPRFFYCVMTKDMPLLEAQQAIGEIIHEIYGYVTAAIHDLSADPAI